MVVIQQFIGRHAAGFDAFFQRVQEMGLIGNQTARTGKRARFQPGLLHGHNLARQIMHGDLAHHGL